MPCASESAQFIPTAPPVCAAGIRLANLPDCELTATHMAKKPIVEAYLKMCPRALLDLRDGKELVWDVWDLFQKPGVYVLYRDDQPYYVGSAKKCVAERIYDHANQPQDTYYNFWDYFSVFLVPDVRHIAEVEGILIAAFPTENASKPKFKRLSLPPKLTKVMHAQRLIPLPPKTKS